MMVMKINAKNIIAVLLALAFISGLPLEAKSRKGKKKDKTETVEKKETAYEKLFKDKKVSTAKGFMTFHLTDEGKFIVELPKSIVGKEMLISSSIEQTSDGGNGISGYMNSKFIHTYFEATDSLVLLKEVSRNKYFSSDSSVMAAIGSSYAGSVLAAFPIETFSPDSSSYVFDATSFVDDHNKRLSPVDPLGANMYNGLVRKEFDRESSRSMLEGVRGYKDNMSLVSRETYSVDASFLGMSLSDKEIVTIKLNSTFYLLPEGKMTPRIADSRIGVKTVAYTRLEDSDRGSKRVDYAQRWRPESPVVFYLDTLFNEKTAEAITKGVLKWNEAFEAIGQKDRLKVLPYPKDDPEFDANNLRYSCIKMENTSNSDVRNNTWIDPRTGEILSAVIYVPYNYFHAAGAELFMSLGAAEASVRNPYASNGLLYETLQAEVSHNVGKCLGLDENLAGSYAVPVDSLHSPSFTRKHGLSGSIMDKLPVNYLATEEDVRRGVKLVHTNIGDYDKYAVKWLYSVAPDAKTPEEEIPYLKNLVKESYSNPLCLYVRSHRNLKMDPRANSGDLGNDNLKSFPQRVANMKYVISNMDKWLSPADKDYTFRTMLNGKIFMGFGYSFLDLLKNIGGVYMNEREEGDGRASYSFVPKDIQRKSLKLALDISDDISWLDNREAYKDIFMVQSFSGFIAYNVVMESIIMSVSKLKLFAGKSDDPYLPLEAYNDIFNHTLKNVRSGKSVSDTNLMMQYLLLGYTISSSGVVGSKQASIGIADEHNGRNPLVDILIRNDRSRLALYPEMKKLREHSGFEPFESIDFLSLGIDENVFYAKLLEAKEVYEKAVKTADKKYKEHYQYFLFAIEKAMKIE